METLVTVSLIKDSDTIRIDYVNGDAAKPLLADTIELLIQALGSMREHMSPPVRESDPEVGTHVLATLDPRWVLASETFVGGALLHVRHPGLGWLAFALPIPSLEQLSNVSSQILVASQEEQRKNQSFQN